MPISPSIAVRDDFKTDSELKVYSMFNRLFGGSENQWVFANVNYVDAGRKLNGQVDFIYLDSRIILFIEVKGGTLRFDKTTGRVTKNYGGSEKDPFKQVTDYIYDFRDKKIKARFPHEYFDQKLAFGYCVILPDAEKPPAFRDAFSRGTGIWTIEYSPALIGDINDLTTQHAFSQFIDRTRLYWLRHQHNLYHKGLSEEELRLLSSFIRDNLKFEIPLPRYLQLSDAQTTLYTKDQGEIILRLIDRNRKTSFLVNGGPGTGKTLIARELLIKRLSQGEKVLFVCRNKSLADFLRRDIMEENPLYLHNAEINHTRGLFEKTTTTNGLHLKQAGSSEKELAAFLIQNKQRLQHMPTFDYLIIDEGQDIFFRENFQVLELYLNGGFSSSHYTVFMDKDSQNSYGDFDSVFFEEFCTTYRPLDYNLTRNCRNTKGIIETSSLYTGTIECECMKTAYQKEKAYFWDTEEELLNLVKTKTDELLNKNVLKRQITILAHPDLIPKIVRQDHSRYTAWSETDEFAFVSDRIMVMTPEAFKGLENNIVIFTGTPLFSSENPGDVALWHVAFTRAKDALVLFLPLKLKDTLSKLYLQNTKKRLIDHA